MATKLTINASVFRVLYTTFLNDACEWENIA